MFFASVFLFLGLLHQGQSAPPNCQQLVKPLDHISPQDLEGKWTLVAGGLNSTAHLERFKTRDSVFVSFVSINGTSMSSTRSYGFNESCQYVDYLVTLRGGEMVFIQANRTVTLIHSICPDCLVMNYERQGDKPVYLFSRRREVDKDEMEEFKLQVECLKLSHVARMDPTKVLCPEQSNQTTTQVPNA